MATPTENKQPSIDLFFSTITAYQRTAALKAGLELELFTAIAEGATTTSALAGRCQASERGIRILCDGLAAMGFLTKSDGRYALTPDSALFLNRKSPVYVGDSYKFLTSETITENFRLLTDAVRKGRTAVSEEGSLVPENPSWVVFARAMAPMMNLVAQMMAERLEARAGKKWKVLDIAAGHGMYGIELARQNPNAEITAVDWRNVLEVAKQNAQQAGVAPRYRAIPGSAFDVEFGSGYDLVLLTNFLHHFDAPTIEKFLRKVRAALVPGGRAVTIEFVPNDDRVSPPFAATFGLVMLAGTPSGDTYTFREYETMFRSAGFAKIEMVPLPPSPSTMIVSAS